MSQAVKGGFSKFLKVLRVIESNKAAWQARIDGGLSLADAARELECPVGMIKRVLAEMGIKRESKRGGARVPSIKKGAQIDAMCKVLYRIALDLKIDASELKEFIE